MGTLLISLLTLLCGASVSLLVFGMDTILRNLPSLLRFAQDVLYTFNLSVYRFYRLLFNLASGHLVSSPLLLPWRAVATSALSLAACALLFLTLGVEWHIWPFVIMSIHGAYIGWVWENLELPDGLWLGENR